MGKDSVENLNQFIDEIIKHTWDRGLAKKQEEIDHGRLIEGSVSLLLWM